MFELPNTSLSRLSDSGRRFIEFTKENIDL
jgi:hypothetical protein